MAAEVSATCREYKFGGWVRHIDPPDVVTDVNGNPAVLSGQPLLQSRGRYGVYVNFLQQVIRPSQINSAGALSLFLNATMADRRTATADYQIAGGLTYSGPFRSRPEDDIGFCGRHTHVNGRVAWSEELQNLAGLGPVGPSRATNTAWSSTTTTAARRPAGATEHPYVITPAAPARIQTHWYSAEDGCEFLTPHRADQREPRSRFCEAAQVRLHRAVARRLAVAAVFA